jgi:outer membrane lipoprotein LolB
LKLFLALLAGYTLLAGCSSMPLASRPARDQLRDFALEARFVLRAPGADGSTQSASGRLDWMHKNGEDKILIANPIGFSLAEIEIGTKQASLRTGDGRQFASTDPEALLQEAIGQSLPLRQLVPWLLGQPGPGGQLTRDELGRPLHLNEADWNIDYFYDEEQANSLPSRLHLRQPPATELRLRIEEWKAHP